MSQYIEKEIVKEFEMLSPLLSSIFHEFRELSKKKQDGVLNPMKVKLTNRILVKIRAILQDDPTIEFLDILDEDALPTNSDVVLIIAQFRSSMELFKSRNQVVRRSKIVWNTEPQAGEEDESPELKFNFDGF